MEDEPSAYFYRLRDGAHEQTGLAGCWALDEYDNGVIKKHERTRPDKEDDRTRHMIALGAQTGPVFMTYRATAAIDAIAPAMTAGEPLLDFVAADGVRHTIWRITGADRDALVAAFERVPALYIADGHHRAASAARARDAFRSEGATRPSRGDGADFNTFLGVVFPHDQVRILPYNRVIRDIGQLSPDAFMQAIRERFDVEPGPAAPGRRGEISMYFDGSWRTLRSRSKPGGGDVIGALDVSVLQNQLLSPVLGIHDVTTDKRIDFVGGARGRARKWSGREPLCFHCLRSASRPHGGLRAGAIMPPKSAWFERSCATAAQSPHMNASSIFRGSGRFAAPVLGRCSVSWRCRVGMSILEISHRSAEFESILAQAEAGMRALAGARRPTSCSCSGASLPFHGADEPAVAGRDSRLSGFGLVGGESDRRSKEGRQRQRSRLHESR